ncbi:hypothetical protein [Streptomyces sp. NPDC029674]|uniref:hypothetical protein n=1 Tax=Streptomyces sp. NPDC029674 TaxID=3365297 RepID=UPI00384E9E14
MSDWNDPMDETTVLVTAADVTLEPIGARALLVDRDALLVPDPPPLLLRPPGPLVAVIAPLPAGSGPVERIAVSEVEHLGSGEPAPGVTASVVRLAGRSRYMVRAEPSTQRRLAEALLAEDGDLWAAMRTLGYDSPVPRRPRRAGLTEAGAGVGEEVAGEEGPDAANGLDPLDRLDAFAAGPCRVIRTCFPHPPRPPQGDDPHRDNPQPPHGDGSDHDDPHPHPHPPTGP